MALSARNQLQGTVQEVRLGEIMAHVVVKVGENLIESVITRTSAEELALKKGDAVRVVIKSTEVMVQKGLRLRGPACIRQGGRAPFGEDLKTTVHGLFLLRECFSGELLPERVTKRAIILVPAKAMAEIWQFRSEQVPVLVRTTARHHRSSSALGPPLPS